MDPTILQVQAYLEKMVSLRNGAVKLYFETQENISPEILSYFLGRNGGIGWLNFAAREITLDEVARLDPIKPDADEEKTPGERLRGRLYVLWKKTQSKGGLTFDAFYRQKMESIIEFTKAKIPE